MPGCVPGGTADWTYDLNWTTSRYPDGSGGRAVIGRPEEADRTVYLRAPVERSETISATEN